jgi:hypothetical protein
MAERAERLFRICANEIVLLFFVPVVGSIFDALNGLHQADRRSIGRDKQAS